LNILPTYLPKICIVSPAFTFNTVAGKPTTPAVDVPKLLFEFNTTAPLT
jgi:hypothetical protein